MSSTDNAVEKYDMNRAIEDPDYSLRWSKEFFYNDVKELNGLVSEFLNSEELTPAEFVDKLSELVRTVQDDFQKVRRDHDSVSHKHNPGWFGKDGRMSRRPRLRGYTYDPDTEIDD